MMFRILLVITLSLCGFGKPLFAATINAESSSQAHVQTAIDSATYGDMVIVPSGSATWKTSLIITKNIALSGEPGSVITAGYTNENEEFATDTVWVKGANWTISDGKATHTDGSVETLSQSVPVVSGGYYIVMFTVADRTAGSVSFTLGGFTGVSRSTNATFEQFVSATNTNALVITPTTDFDGSITSCKIIPWLIRYNPDATALAANGIFTLKNFTVDLDNKGSFFSLSNSSTTFAILKTHGNTLTNMSSDFPLKLTGQFSGVIYDNYFSGYYHFDIYGSNDVSWNNLTYEHGSGDQIYLEDNTITTTYNSSTWANGTIGAGGRSCYRYNSFIDDADYEASPWLDNHGNQGVGSNHAPMAFELYGNYFEIKYPTGHTKTPNINRNRGGTGMRWGNYAYSSDAESAYATFYVQQDEYPDTNNLTDFACPTALQDASLLYPETLTCAENGRPQHVHDCYYWLNRMGDAAMSVGLEAGEGIEQNVHFWVQSESFDGTSGVGCGTIANRPATCTTGVGYWATDQSCSDLTGMVGAYPATPISGTLYKCTETNTWTAYYTPYTYPHPLRWGDPVKGINIGSGTSTFTPGTGSHTFTPN